MINKQIDSDIVPEQPNFLIPVEGTEVIEYKNNRYKEFAAILRRLQVLQNSNDIQTRLLDTAAISQEGGKSSHESEIEVEKGKMHDLLLNTHSFPSQPRLVITSSDISNGRPMLDEFDFRDRDAEDLAYRLDLIAGYQRELEGYFDRESDLAGSETDVMIKDATHRLKENIAELMEILTGKYDE